MPLASFRRWTVAAVAVAGALGCGKKTATSDPAPVADAASCATVGPPRPDKARYRPGDPVAISVDATAHATPRWRCRSCKGFISTFPPGQSRQTGAVQTLAEDMQLDVLQFYDWEWRHEKLIEPNPGGSPRVGIEVEGCSAAFVDP